MGVCFIGMNYKFKTNLLEFVIKKESVTAKHAARSPSTKILLFFKVRMMDDDAATKIQLQCMMDELISTKARVERAERRIQMLTDAFVVSGLWRTSSSLESWTEGDDRSLQFQMTND